MKTFTLPLLIAVGLVSCAPPAPDAASDRKAIEEITQKAARDLLAGVWDTTLATYADDAVSMPHGAPMMKGKETIRAQMIRMMGMGMKFSKVVFTTLDVQVNGNSAFEIGTFDMTYAMGDAPVMNEGGKYLTVYERAADGSWKIKAETFNLDAPTPPPTQ